MEEFKTIVDQLKNGSLVNSYGQKYLVTVSPVPSIHKVKWSIVELHTGGKVYSDFYMSMEQMRQLCDEIDNGRASAKLQKDAESQYPGAYKYVTGENGCKKLNIGGGQKGIRVQIQIKKGDSWDNKMSVIAPADFLQMKFLFFLTMGLTLFHKNSYYASLYDAFWEGEAKRAEYFTKNYSEKEDSEVREMKEVVEEVKTEAPKESHSEPPKASENDYLEIDSLKLKVTTSLSDEGNNRYKLSGKTREGKDVNVWFDETITNTPEWMQIKAFGERVGSIMTVTGLGRNNNILVKTVAV